MGNTLIQDVNIPIYILLTYSGGQIKFPVNPEKLKINKSSASQTVNVSGLGEVSIPGKSKLATISIESFFWQEVNYTPSSTYVLWLERWQESEKPAYLTVTRLGYSMKVTCENFEHWIKAGEEEDVYFKLDMKEYKDFGAKLVTPLNVADSVLTTIKKIYNGAPVVLWDVPKPNRNRINKTIYTSPYITKEGDTVTSITKTITGSTDNWQKLYDTNKKILADYISSDKSIPSGTNLILPEEWTKLK